MKSILERRSIRKFKADQVEDEKLHALLEAGMAAPTAGNQREWEFIVVTDEEILQKLAVSSPHSKPTKNAPMAIVPVGSLADIRFPQNFEQDLAAACENILLEAVEQGLGAVWMGIAPEEDRMKNVSEILGLPGHIKPFAILAIGYPDETPSPRKIIYDESKVHYNKY